MSWLAWLSFPPPNDTRPKPTYASSQPATSSNSIPQPNASSTTSTTDAASTSSSAPAPWGSPSNPTIIQRNRPLALLLVGTAFALLSARATRRAVVKRQSAVRPHFYHPSNEPPLTLVSGPFEAVEALSLATVNVASWGMVWTGGVLWGFGINGVEDMRRKVRGGLGIEGERAANEARADEEIEEWMARVLERGFAKKGAFQEKDVKELDEILESRKSLGEEIR